MTRSKNAPIPAVDYPVGTRFGLVTIVGPAPSHGTGRVFRVRCDCGDERDVAGSSLRQSPPSTHRMCGRTPQPARLSLAEQAEILKRTSTIGLLELLAIKAADGLRRGDASGQSFQVEATVARGPTALVRVQITKKRITKRAGSRTPNESRKGAA